MLILIPPSEGKYVPARGKPLDLSTMASPALNPLREQILDALQDLCANDPATAIDVLGLGRTQFDLLVQNSQLTTAPSAAASTIYNGVLYAALDYASLRGQDLRRANRRLAIVSGLFGLVRPTDRICSYRLSGGVKLPGVGPLVRFWRDAVSEEITGARGLVIDMLSSPYASMVALPPGAVTVKVWQETTAGQRTAVSHFNKATKGELARTLVTSAEDPRTSGELLELLRSHRWKVDLEGDRLNVLMR